MEKKIIEKFGKRLRTRVCGILIENDRILLVKHKYLGPAGTFWAPPGGGMEYGTPAADNLQREFKEETGLQIGVTRFLFLHEFLRAPLHAVELFFEVKRTGGNLKKGVDPEMEKDQQIIESVEFVEIEKLSSFPTEKVHQILRKINEKGDILNLKGYINFDYNREIRK